MKITIEESVKIKKDVEVTFPIYRKHWLDNSTVFMKIESAEKQVNIHVYDDDRKVEVEIEKPSFWGTEDYLLGKGEHKSSEAEFNNAVEDLDQLRQLI